MRRLLWSVLVLQFVGCASEPGSDSIPANATTMSSYMTAGVMAAHPKLFDVEAVLPFLLNAGSPGAGGLTFNPTGPPNTYTFGIPLDADGNGSDETTLAGTAAFNGDPSTAGVGFGGHVDFTMNSAGGLGNFTGEVDFAMTATGRQVSGGGTFVEGVSGNMTTLTVPAASPLMMTPTASAANPVANTCGYSVQGDAQFEVEGPLGTLASVLEFRSNSSAVMVTGITYTDNNGTSTDLPDTQLIIPCGGDTSFSDWTGVFLQDWACLPLEFGQAELTFTVTGGTLNISDEDPPGSGSPSIYTAAPMPGNSHTVRGYFIAGPAGFTYREDFSWKLTPNNNTFSQVSYYRYLEGPNVGTGGICGGWATRQ